MDELHIVYVDDNIDTGLSRYLDEEYNPPNFQKIYVEVEFDPSLGYESLIQNPKIQAANIILIDSRLFENGRASAGKFTGEEFKIILKKYYPFIEVIVITQNKPDIDMGTISKYNASCGKSNKEYYDNTLPQYFANAINNLQIYRQIAKNLKENPNWEDVLKEKILNSLNGIVSYDELTKADIDNLVTIFNEIQDNLNG
ncbi:hypothetical protein K7I13_03620 [Brucepastera parasyntrophica]|uniref:hypothetical protein n=1 Tax=Brucepastera parasyntrophica TaxID=2880008 RepID=UPI00210C9A29|nr:hypothetical protein [Brucepastera parasyntrophica]ULQ60409.1 hypothetical protein K7I13_03620 [Brucepastera parasyntrophica]